MTEWLYETLIWTAVLIGFVLLVRRPMAKIFGARATYALWVLPFLRLILPPLVLPAWVAPKSTAEITSFYTVALDESAPALQAMQTTAPFDWALVGLAVWLLGATIFLAIRFRFYFLMRNEMLDGARPVGKAGKVRLIETPGTLSPIAFGVIDKVIALPQGFMALTDRTKRDLALEHELSHHNAHDLLANFVVQPLFALHWFNPLGWYGWRAMRSDQEAACDARVMSARNHEDRAAYASVIASFAAGPNIALAAPMACPVIGEKSIIHRLRSLTMTDISPRRRIAGRVLLVTALLALPLTASVSYAESLVAPSAPIPPAPPSAITAPTTPTAPTAMQAQTVQEAPEAARVEKRVVIVRKNQSDDEGANGDHSEHGDHKIIHRDKKVIIHGDENLSEAERHKIMEEMHKKLKEADVEVEHAKRKKHVAMMEMRGEEGYTKVSTHCWDRVEIAGKEKAGKVCTSEVMASALDGVKQARAEIAANDDLDDQMRAKILKALDEKIANWGS